MFMFGSELKQVQQKTQKIKDGPEDFYTRLTEDLHRVFVAIHS